MAKDIEEKKRAIVYEVFVDTADSDYIVARWLYLNGMHRHFFWSACQAIEKYIKAILVINNLSVLKLKHNINKSFTELTKTHKIQDSFIVPAEVELFNTNPELWGSNSIKDFVSHINKNGNAANRYDTFSIISNFSDLYKLDQIVSILRNISSSNEWSHELIKLIDSSESIKQALYDNNFSMAPKFKHTKIVHTSKGHVTELEILFKNNISGYQELRSWVTSNIYEKTDLLK
jgi:hypothetical protein